MSRRETRISSSPYPRATRRGRIGSGGVDLGDGTGVALVAQGGVTRHDRGPQTVFPELSAWCFLLGGSSSWDQKELVASLCDGEEIKRLLAGWGSR